MDILNNIKKIKIKKIIFCCLLVISQFVLATDYRHIKDCSRIPSYDTTYIEGIDTFRQIYINNGNDRTETFILIKNDSTILFDIEKY